jgi:hypothetical protein
VPDHRTPTRRQLLAAAGVAAAAAAGLSGCAEAAHRDPAAATGDETLARQTARASAGLLAAYRATAVRHTDLRRVLQPLAAHHAEHLAVLAPDRPPRATAPRVAGSRTEALTVLRRRERSVATARRSATVEAASGDLARILAAVVACQAQHLVLLDAELEGR